jgi:AcrR family transcriptional regulator
VSSETTANAISEAEDARSRLKRAQRALVREAIVDAAERVFAEHGYEAAKVQAVARQAGVSLAKLYDTFPKKSDIFRAVQADRLDALLRQVGAAVLEARSPFDRLRLGIEGYLRFHMERPEFLRLQLREQVPWGTTDEQRTPEQTRAWELGLAMMTATFAEGMRAGIFVQDDPELCARTVTAMSQVRLALWMDRGQTESPDDVAAATVRQLVRTFVVAPPDDG